MFRAIKITLASLCASFLLLLAIATILAQRGAAAFLLMPLLLIVVMMIIFFAVSAAGARKRRAWMILGSLEQAFRMNLPLPRLVASMAESEPGPLGRDLRRVYEALQTGAPFAVALGVLPSVPERILRLVISAERIGRLPQVLGRLIEQRNAAIASRAGRLPFYRVYPLLLAAVYIGITSMLFIFVIPKFQAIFKDFNLRLPDATLLLLRVAHDYGVLLMLLGLLSFFTFVSAALGSWWPGATMGAVERFSSLLFDYVPFISRMRMQGSLAEMLNYCADAMEAGYPIDVSLREASEIATNSRLRLQLRNWTTRLDAGESPAQAARSARMPALLAGMINSSSHSGDLPDVFRFLARYYAYRHAATASLLEASILPVLALSMGVLVAWLMIALLLPMVALIDKSSIPYQPGL